MSFGRRANAVVQRQWRLRVAAEGFKPGAPYPSVRQRYLESIALLESQQQVFVSDVDNRLLAAEVEG